MGDLKVDEIRNLKFFNKKTGEMLFELKDDSLTTISTSKEEKWTIDYNEKADI